VWERPVYVPDAGMTVWKREDWNTVRVRVAGDAPHATVWINSQQVSDDPCRQVCRQASPRPALTESDYADRGGA